MSVLPCLARACRAGTRISQRRAGHHAVPHCRREVYIQVGEVEDPALPPRAAARQPLVVFHPLINHKRQARVPTP